MADKFRSPGVFLEEIDRSVAEEGAPQIGALVVGRFPKGPAVPKTVANRSMLIDTYGDLNSKYTATYAAQNYLKNSNRLTVVNVLGHRDGGSNTNGYNVGGITGISDVSGSGNGQILAVVHHSGNTDVVSVAGVSGDADRFVFTVGSFSVTASFLTASADYIEKVLNTDPTRYSTDNHYLYQVFKYATPAASASWETTGISGSHINFNRDFTSGSTPWVLSQPLGGTEHNLFRFHTLKHGRATNDEIKVVISNVKPSQNAAADPYGTFDITVRKFYDSDLKPEVLETFTALSLDPNSPNYLPRRVGDQFDEFDTNTRKLVTNGNFRNKSNHVRVEMFDNSGAGKEALPWGFNGYTKFKYLDDNGTATTTNTIPALPYRVNQKDGKGNYSSNYCWGVLFVSGGIVDRMRAQPDNSGSMLPLLEATDTAFSLKHLSGTYENGKLRYHYVTATTSYQPIFLSSSLQKFAMPFQGGFDGWDLRTENPLDIANNATNSNHSVISVQRAIDNIANPDLFEYNLLAIPGIHNTTVADYARNLANDRKDFLYLMQLTGSTVAEVIDNVQIREIDDNYVASYYPDLKIDDPVNNEIVRIDPTVAVLGVMAYNDRVSQPWFAPAGFNRGGLSDFDVVDTVDRLTYEDRSNLYENRVNPIATFPNQGIVVHGQKTMQVASSALDRINVRRLLIEAKYIIKNVARTLLFEPNDPTTWQTFVNRVNPILNDIRQKRGVLRFKVVMDSTTNTDDVVDRNIMRGKIFLQPTKAAEYIDLSFIVTSSGVEFSE